MIPTVIKTEGDALNAVAELLTALPEFRSAVGVTDPAAALPFAIRRGLELPDQPPAGLFAAITLGRQTLRAPGEGRGVPNAWRKSVTVVVVFYAPPAAGKVFPADEAAFSDTTEGIVDALADVISALTRKRGSILWMVGRLDRTDVPKAEKATKDGAAYWSVPYEMDVWFFR